MDRGAWQTIVHGVAKVRHDLATEPSPPSYYLSCVCSIISFSYPLLFCLQLGYVLLFHFILSFFFFILSFHAFCGSYVNYSMHPLFKTVVCLEGYFMNNLRSFNFLSSPLRSCYTFHSSSCQSLYLHIHLSSINNAL